MWEADSSIASWTTRQYQCQNTNSFKHIGLDTMTLDGRKYLVCVDYFSKYTKVDRLKGISSGYTVKLIRKHFMRYGIWEEVVRD